jgi:hypothetical protein
MEDQLNRIKRKAREQGKWLNPCLPEASIAEFEHKHRVRLPEEYREFLLQVGNGGPGPPFYGLAAMGDVADDLSPHEEGFWRDFPRIADPFPFSHSWCWERGDESHEGTKAQVGCGSIYLGNDGCGMYWHLIVTGPDRGRVWQLTGEGIAPTMPKRNFLEWYEDWLDGVDNWWAQPE